jgi:trimeric autotransporter adhesin
MPVDRPAVAAVTSAASYGPAVAPGQMVVVWGSHLGPDELAGLQVDGSGMVSTASSGVRVLFDGLPAPLVYAKATQCSAVVPYFGASKATTHVQVEYQGVRSDPFPVAVGATAPGLFTVDASGTGQAAALNEDGVTPNSTANPAPPGSIVVMWATGEGITDPPGVDGRPATDVLPKPEAPVSVTIGGLPATVLYAGAAPGMMPGVFQINARISKDVVPSDKVAAQVRVGNVTSQDGVIVAVR